MMHLGLIRPRLRGNTESYKGLIKSVIVITVIDTIILGSFSLLVNLINGSASISQLFLFICVPTVACTLAVCLSIPITSILAIQTFKRGLDPDIMVYPILASVNDIVVTGFFVTVVFLVLIGGAYFTALTALFVLILAVAGYLWVSSRDDPFFQQTLREGTFVVVMSSVFGGVNGVLLSNMSGVISSTPGMMTMYPALTNALGNIGSIIGSKTTTDIAMGYSKSFMEELRESGRSIIQVEAPAAVMHVLFAIVSFILSAGQGASLITLIGIALSTNLMSFIVIATFSLWSAHLAFERGLNPDNIVIPAITSVSDTTATVMVNPAVMLVKILVP